MQLQITGHHVEITAGLKQFLAAKLARLEESYPLARKVSVVVTVEKYRHTAEIHFHADGVEMSAKKTTKDMYASLEQAIQALEQQAAKRKDRLRTGGSLRRGAAKVEKRGTRAIAKEAPSAPAPRVTRLRQTSPKSLDLDGAVAAMEASGQAFLLFKDPNRSGTQLLLRREGGAYAVT
ncbi:MAG: ribosome hibernation-promoting factor, HPF/YfiA family, partial [bacterium]